MGLRWTKSRNCTDTGNGREEQCRKGEARARMRLFCTDHGPRTRPTKRKERGPNPMADDHRYEALRLWGRRRSY